MLLEALGLGLLGAGTTAVGNAINANAMENTNRANLQATRETNAQNLQIMRDSWARDDNAVQRRTADLKAAGISPLMAAGSAATNSGPVNMQAPKMEAKRYDLSRITDGIMQGVAVARSTQDIENAKQQEINTAAQTSAILQDMALKKEMQDHQIALMGKQGYASVTSANASASQAYTAAERQKMERERYNEFEKNILTRNYLTAGLALDNLMIDFQRNKQGLKIDDRNDTRATWNTVFNAVNTVTGAGKSAAITKNIW